MKQKFILSFLALTFGMASSAWAIEKDGNVYQIATAQDLADFASLVNEGEFTANAVLTDDIVMSELDSWTAIGDWGEKSGTASAGYKGHFDGQGHTIYNFSFSSTHNYYGIFGVIWGTALVENFTVEGDMTVVGNIGYAAGAVAYTNNTPTIRNVHSKVNISSTSTAGTPRLGGVVGGCPAQNSKTTIDRCTYSGTLDANEKGGNYGGIVGYILNNANVTANITNCLFNGKLKGSVDDNKAQYGGIIGYTRKGIVSVKNCLSIGTFEYEDGNAMNIGQFIGRLTFDNGTSGCTFTDNYYKDMGYELYGTSSGGAPKGSAPTAVTTEQLASGEIAYALNGEQSDDVSWFQKLGTDEYPTLNGSDIVYLTGHLHCDGTPYEGETAFSNIQGSVKDNHSFTDGYCSYCGAIDADYMTANVEGFLEIGTPNQLKWFADYVNQIDPAANAVLTADIDLDGIAWTPIGNADNKYSGTFDGRGHAITNFSYTATSDNNGLFGYIDGATVMNFSISGTLTSTFTKNGVVGRADGAAVVSGIHSSLNLNVSNCKAHTGGIVGGDGGNTQHTLLVENCIYDGTLTHSGTGDCQGGILGYAYMGGIKNCIFSGTIIGENSKYGGMLGYCKIATFGGVQNCLSIGNIVCDGGCTTAAAIIGVWNGPVSSNIKNNFYCLEEGSTPTVGVTYGKDGKTLTGIDAVDADQLSSGEVAYKLGTAFYQTIGSDNYPVLDSTHGVVGKIADCGYGTLYAADTDVTIPSGITAYAGKNNGTSIKLTAIADKIKAGEAVVLVGDEGFYSFMPTTGASDVEENDLEGSDGTVTTDDSYIVYALANKTNGVGFYKVSAGVKVPAGRAYFKVSTGASAKAFYLFGEEDATSLSEELRVKSEESDAAIYNLSGQRISKLQKGFNIVNGKKVLF